ncbi:MAG TPA: Ku protein [Steroidobacteraceae bacterium]|jgi:DNA end-binding protein Ku|nr:Ku protein [Steroidobacteraceae bacterium]
MAARSIASLTIAFGLVAIPVKLYSATVSSERLRFNLLHEKDGSRLKQQYVCLEEQRVVGREEIVKGYEFAKDQYVMFTPEELRALEEAGTHSVDVAQFVPLAAVDPVYFERTYYLAPDQGGAKPFTLFVTALRDSGRCAVGRWASHGRDHVVILRPIDNALALHQLHFAPEVQSVSALGVESAKVRDTELKLARQLIAQQSADTFDPGAFPDEVKARVEEAIQRKVEGRQVTVSEPRAEPGSNVVDLMSALKASLERDSAAAGPRSDGRERAATRRAPKRAVARAPARGHGRGHGKAARS